MYPKISVCIPVYNVEKYIRRCLESIFMQDFKEIEIIVVDDCSPDNSMAIVRELAESDPRIRIIRNDRNMGLNWTRRTGYEAAKGDYIFFLDSDDTIPSSALLLLYEKAVTSDADIVIGQVSFVSGGKKDYDRFSNRMRYESSLLENLVEGNIKHNLCGKLYKRRLLQGHNYITYEQLTNGEDALLFYQVAEQDPNVAIIDDVVYNYIYNENSSSVNILSDKALHNIMTVEGHIQDIIDRYPDLKGVYLNKYVINCSVLITQVKSGTDINSLMSEYGIPLKMNLNAIFTYTSGIDRLACLIRFLFPWAVKFYRHIKHNFHYVL